MASRPACCTPSWPADTGPCAGADGQMKWAVRRVRSKKQPCVWRVLFAPGVLRGRKRGDVGFSHPRAADVAPYTSIQTGILAVTRDSSRVRNDN